MASGFLFVFLLCITVTNGIFFPWIHIHKPVHHRCKVCKVCKVCPAPPRPPHCPHGWSQHGSRCFIVQNSRKTMADAECACVALGGNLASIHKHSELTFIRKLIFKRCHVHQSVWIGLSDAIQEGKWLWTDGSKVDYKCWSHGEPNNFSEEHCTEITSNGYSWNDLSCLNEKPFICARKL